MARRTSKSKGPSHRVFNVTYEDGMVTSNRRIPNELLDQSFGDDLLDLALAAIQNQDNAIAQRAKQRRAKIKSIVEV